MKRVSIAVVGAGSRGRIYADYVRRFPDQAEVVAVCDPRDDVRAIVAGAHRLDEGRRFRDWRDLAELPRIADAALICTQDTDHLEPAVALARKGYHLLLEKPMAPRLEDCIAIHAAAVSSGIILAVCHVLRYAPVNRKLKSLIGSGIIGDLHHIDLIEPVGYWHQAHSFVRGNWGNEARSSSMLLAKSCHDMDLLNYLIPSRCVKVASFGELSFFNEANRPAGAADRCVDCPEHVESACPYSAIKIYIRDRGDQRDRWPNNVLIADASMDSLTEAIRTGSYGRCAFSCDNDVVDHQAVILSFADGQTAAFTMSAFTKIGSRETYVMGDRGTLRTTESTIEHYDFLTDGTTSIPVDSGDGQITSGHGGGDDGIMNDFIAAVTREDPGMIASGPDVSLESHMIVFAAEQARRTGTVVSM